MANKLIFIETRDVCETKGAIAQYRHACDCGKGAVLFCVARGKVAEGVEFSGEWCREYTRSILLRLPIASYCFLLLPIAPSVSCSCVDALNTPSNKLPLSPTVSRFLQSV